MSGNVARIQQSDLQPTGVVVSGTTSAQPVDNVRRLRLQVRRAVQIHTVAQFGDRFFPAEIRNISQGGAGLVVARAVAPGESCNLILPDGRKIAATVRWTRMGFCGVQFDELLRFDHPLLGEITTDPNIAEPLTPAPASAKSEAARPKHRSKKTRGPMASTIVAGHWAYRRIVGRIQMHRLIARSKKFQRMLEAACRKQGFSWLVD